MQLTHSLCRSAISKAVLIRERYVNTLPHSARLRQVERSESRCALLHRIILTACLCRRRERVPPGQLMHATTVVLDLSFSFIFFLIILSFLFYSPMCRRKHRAPGSRVSVRRAQPATGVARAQWAKDIPAGQTLP